MGRGQAQRFSGGMPAITCSTWRPQPTQVGLPQRLHWIRVHISWSFSHGVVVAGAKRGTGRLLTAPPEWA